MDWMASEISLPQHKIPPVSSLSSFHPAVRDWFASRLGEPTAPQRDGWPHIRAGRHTLIAAPTGSGKTLAAFLSAIDALLRSGPELIDETRVLYVSPLRALANDVQKNLLGPLAPNPSWLVNAKLAMPSIAIFVAWKQLGFFILLYLAALQNVPKELYEAASVDGANAWRSFWSVTVPGVKSATTLVVILAIITGANLFTEPYLLTNGGGPDGASTSPVLLIYQKGIQQQNPDVAAAIGVILVLGVMVISLVNKYVLERD